MFELITWISLILAVSYAGPMLAFAIGYGISLRRRCPPPSATASVSVIVAARNEESQIGRCLQSILSNSYPREKMEVVVVDDHSEDATVERINSIIDCAGESMVRLLRAPEDHELSRGHKKRAIAHGIAHAKGDVILVTDADCFVPPDWIRAMTGAFEPNTGFVAGPVEYPSTGSVFERVLALEFMGLSAIAAGAIGLGRPILCNGANIAYRKEAFREVGGFSGHEHFSSGDDELLMQRIADKTRWKVEFCAKRRAVVQTRAPGNIAEFLNQRRRWASKGAHYERRSIVVLNVCFYLFFLWLAGLTISSLFHPEYWSILIAVVSLKVISEWAILFQAAVFFRKLNHLVFLLPAQPFQIIYILWAGLAGVFGNFEWKARKLVR